MPPQTQLITLDALLAGLRPEQREAEEAAVDHLIAADRARTRGNGASLLLVSPTGTGKSYIQGAIHRVIRETHHRTIYTTFPSSEIAEAVFLKTYGNAQRITFGEGWESFTEMSAAKRQETMESYGFWTIKRLLNELTAGRVPLPDFLQHDEAHHSVDDTHEVAHGICGLCPRVGATATDYRGTAVETAKFRERWPRQHRVLTLRRAVDLGRLSMPTWSVWPLLNDELIDVTNGEFSVKSVESHLTKVLDDLVDRLKPFYGWHNEDGQAHTGWYDRPTMIAVSSVGAVEAVVEALKQAGLPAVGVTGETTDKERTAAFQACVSRNAILVQIRVVGEGVDLPIRRLIDLAPTVSPVLWMQRVGRITRPVGVGEDPPEYIACCHNLARHAYLWHGVMPPSAIKDAMQAWGKDFKPSRRFLARVIDIEGLGRFQPAAIPFADGSVGTMYAMQSKDGADQYAIVLHPLRPDPWFFARTIPFTGNMLMKVFKGKDGTTTTVEYRERDYNNRAARWRRIGALPELRGMQSIKPGQLTETQKAWWRGEDGYEGRGAESFGLDPKAEITNREFQILPILANSRAKLEV